MNGMDLYEQIEDMVSLYLRAKVGMDGKAFAISRAAAEALTLAAWSHIEPYDAQGAGRTLPFEAIRIFDGRFRVPVVIVEDAPRSMVLLLAEADARALLTPPGPGGRR